MIKIKPLSKKQKKKLLRPAKANELKRGGVWYYKNEEGDFQMVISDMDSLGMTIENYRTFVGHASKFGYMYINRAKPNYSLTTEVHGLDLIRMRKYES